MSSDSSSSSSSSSSSGFVAALSLMVDLGLVFASHIGYVVQYIEIAKTGNIEGYACLVSLILLTSNTLRVFYFFGERFALALFFQAVVAIFVHGALLLKVLEVHKAQLWAQEEANAPRLPPPPMPADATEADHIAQLWDAAAAKPETSDPAAAGGVGAATAAPSVDDGNLDKFAPVGPAAVAVALPAPPPPPRAQHMPNPNEFILFRLEDMLTERFLAYTPVSFLYTYGVVAGGTLAFILVVMYYLLDAAAVVGYLAMGIEAMLVVPQILRNARRKSTQGLTLFLVFTWVFGDLVKLVYFLVKSQPTPFIVCGIIQIAFDIVVIAQLWMYRQTRQFLATGLQGISSETS